TGVQTCALPISTPLLRRERTTGTTGSDQVGLSSSVVAAIDTTRLAGFRDHDFGEQRQFGLEPPPNPRGEAFARWILQAGNVIEIKMIELPPDRFERGGD